MVKAPGASATYTLSRRDALRVSGAGADDDVFFGARLALNDEQDSAVLVAGAVVDRRSQATLLFVEAERCLGDSWKIELEGSFFRNVPGDDPLAGIRDDDVVTLRLTKFF
mgnify:CR=1 FL=1